MEALNDIVSENLNKHITDNNLNLLGYPLNDPDQQPADLDNQEDIDFCFEAAIRPEVKIDLASMEIEAAKVLASDEEVNKTIDNIIERNPNIVHAETVGENDKLELKICEAEDGKEVEDGFKKNIFFHIDQIKDQESAKILHRKG